MVSSATPRHCPYRALNCRFAFVAWACLLAGSVGAWEPIRLTSYPQTTRNFFSLTDSNVPAALALPGVPLPVGGITATATSTDGALWLGTTQGLVILEASAPPPDRVRYLSGLRYLPDDQVENLVPNAHNGVWVRTRSGVAHIERRALTLEQKARFFEQRIHARHDRYGLVADSALAIPGDVSSNRLVDNDNDGLWTAMYAAAECFRYAVTQSPEALASARKSIEAVLFLEEVAGRRGFPARSYIRKGDPMPEGGEWHWTGDGKYYWKGDTSSDEIVGHFFIFSIAYDLLHDDGLKRRIAATARRILNHILDHGYGLSGPEGKPTTWGWWGPEKLAQQPDERALNSLEWLSFLKTGFHITGDPRYDAEYRKAVSEFKYADLMTRVNEFRQELNYSDEELAMLPFYCLFRYETDPALLAPYRQALDQWWSNLRRESNPLWTFIYLLGQPNARADLTAAVWTLSRMPMDTIQWNVRNSNRHDLVWAKSIDRAGQRETLNLLPPDERPVMKWNSNPFVVDGGSGGNGEDDGAAFLLPYWLGRHHGFLLGE